MSLDPSEQKQQQNFTFKRLFTLSFIDDTVCTGDSGNEDSLCGVEVHIFVSGVVTLWFKKNRRHVILLHFNRET